MGEQTRDPSEGQGSSGPTVRDRRRLDPETGQVRDESGADRKTADVNEKKDENGASGGGSGKRRPAHAAETPEETGPDAPDASSSTEDGAREADGQKPESADEPSLDGILADLDAARSSAAERLGDLQRLQAEFVNYRRRVDRDRDVAKEAAIAGVLEALLPVLDDVHLARQHGDLESGPFAAIAEKLEAVLQRFGLARYGEAGEEFDPEVHEALMRTEAELAEGTTTTTVVQVLQPGYRSGDRVLRAARVAVADPH